MDIARLFPHFELSREIKGGLEPNCYYLSKEQAKKGHNVTVFSYSDKEEREEEIDGFKLVYLKKPRFRRWFTGLKYLNHLKRTGKNADIVQSFNPSGFGWLFPLAKKNLNAKFVLSLHGSFLAYKKGQAKDFKSWVDSFEFSKLCSYLSRKVDSIFAVSGIETTELYSFGIPKSKIHRIPSGVDFKLFSKNRKAKKEGDFTILYVGRFAHTKGVEYLIRAFSLLCKKNIKLLLVGASKKNNDYYHVLKLVKSLGIEKKVEIIPPVKYSELPKYYAKADIFVLPSVVDAWAKVVLEAMASGIPVVVSTGAGISEIIADKVNGLKVFPKNEKEIANAIEKLIEDKQLKDRLVKNGFKTAINYDWKKIALRQTKKFEELLEEK